MTILNTHDLSGSADADEVREYRQFPNGTICLYISRGHREGVYCWRDNQWKYDPQLTSEFEWDRPYGEFCAFLPSSFPISIRLDAFLSYTERMLLDPDRFLAQGRDRIRTQYIEPARSLLEQVNNEPGARAAVLAGLFEMTGQKDEAYFSACWRNGTMKNIIDNMKQSLKWDQDPAKEDDVKKAVTDPSIQADKETFEKCLSYFTPKRGLANDFIFPGKLLDELSKVNRQKIENMVIFRCLQGGDKRFFDALAYCKLSNLNTIFTGKIMQTFNNPETKAKLLRILYQSTGNPRYLEQMIRMAPGHELTYYYICGLIEEMQGPGDDPEAIRKADRYQLIWHAVKTIAEIRHASGWYKHNPLKEKWGPDKYQEIALLSQPELKELTNTDDWYFEGIEDFLIFYHALAWSFWYQETHDQKYLLDIMRAALLNPEVYDVFRYMQETRIITREEIRQALNARKKESQKPSDSIYAKKLKEMLIEKALVAASPESVKDAGGFDADLLYQLGMLQWNDPGCYNLYVENFKIKNDKNKHYSNSTEETSDYARNMDRWDYDTCLSYLICLQKLAYWSGGLEHPLYDQIASGTVRRVLLRMKKLLRDSDYESHIKSN